MIDLRSDTVTRPSPAMRAAMAAAEVGDDVLDGDPTTRRLEAQVAERLGKERALFFPSGTMANQAAVAAWTRPGTELYVDADAHLVHWELAGVAALAGVQIRPVAGRDGRPYRAADLLGALRDNPFHPQATLVAVENTHNGSGGTLYAADEVAAIAEVAKARGLPLHCDGARLWNAAVAQGVSPAELAAPCDSVMVSFSKGLGAPVGACLAGPASLIARAHEVRKRLGGGMRQSGILAAAALLGLEDHETQLREDHRWAGAFAAGVAVVPGVRVVAPETNIVMVDLPPGLEGPAVAAAAKAQGVLLSAWSRTRVRAVFHRDVRPEQVGEAVAVVTALLSGAMG
jgi:threonine aldolase